MAHEIHSWHPRFFFSLFFNCNQCIGIESWVTVKGRKSGDCVDRKSRHTWCGRGSSTLDFYVFAWQQWQGLTRRSAVSSSRRFTLQTAIPTARSTYMCPLFSSNPCQIWRSSGRRIGIYPVARWTLTEMASRCRSRPSPIPTSPPTTLRNASLAILVRLSATITRRRTAVPSCNAFILKYASNFVFHPVFLTLLRPRIFADRTFAFLAKNKRKKVKMCSCDYLLVFFLEIQRCVLKFLRFCKSHIFDPIPTCDIFYYVF